MHDDEEILWDWESQTVAETYRQKLYPLAGRVFRIALDIIGQCPLTVTGRGLTDPKLLVLALLSRTLANFRGVVLLIKADLVVEARVLTRCCYENMFLCGSLLTEGEAFADKMIVDEAAGRKNRARFTFENEGIFNALSPDVQSALKETYRRAARQTSMLDKELAELEPSPYEFRFKFDDHGVQHNYENGDWETHVMFWRWREKYGEQQALARMDVIFNDEYPRRGMVFAIGNQAKRPQVWQLLGVIRLDDTGQAELAL
jgi:hypothetical protein